MRLTPRDHRLLDRLYREQACDAAGLADLFPTRRALEQRLWLLVRHRYLVAHRVGRQRAYLLGPAGARAVGLAAPPRLAPASIPRLLEYGRLGRMLQAEGYAVGGSLIVGRVRLMRAQRGGRRIGVVVCGQRLSVRGVGALIRRLRPAINPFRAAFDEVILFVPNAGDPLLAKLPASYRDRISLRAVPRER